MMIAGAIPGQRFLLPVSMLACLPAARFWSAHLNDSPLRSRAILRPTVLTIFIASFTALSIAHENFQRGHLAMQEALYTSLPPTAHVFAAPELLKEFAPVDGLYNQVDGLGEVVDRDSPDSSAYIAWSSVPGARVPGDLSEGRRSQRIRIRSWFWNRDLWLFSPKD